MREGERNREYRQRETDRDRQRQTEKERQREIERDRQREMRGRREKVMLAGVFSLIPVSCPVLCSMASWWLRYGTVAVTLTLIPALRHGNAGGRCAHT